MQHATMTPGGQRPSRLVLWDIDHTLIESRGVGGDLWAETFQAVTGQPMQRQTALAGKTEPTLVSETMALHGIEPTDWILNTFFDTLADRYDANIQRLSTQGRALPGAAEALRALADRQDVISSVLTGNLRRVAVTKLTAFSLDRYLDLDIGAYGSDDSIRANLVDIARKRAQAKYGVAYAGTRTILIGDTPNDIAAARSSGARFIGVATGKTTAHELSNRGAVAVLPDLTDLNALLHEISSRATRSQ